MYIGGRLFAVGNFPPLIEAAEIAITGTIENLSLVLKVSKNEQGVIYEVPGFSRSTPIIQFFFGFREIAFAWTTTPTRFLLLLRRKIAYFP